MVAFGGPEAHFERPPQIENYLALRFNDIAEARPGLQEPKREHVEELLSIARNWDRAKPLILQCWLGVSRSTAAAAIATTFLRPDLEPQAVAAALRAASPVATPNPLMIEHADALLGHKGTFSAAIAAIGRGREAAQGIPFSLDLDSL